MPVEVITIDFSRNDAQQQAKQILDKVRALNQQGHKQVGITYSANQGQTKLIKSTYGSGKWQTHTSGANQAEVIAAVEQLLTTLEYKNLQTVFRIVPITTIDYQKTNQTALDDDVQQSLDNASQFIKDGGYLLGWANQLTNGSVAIGGGVALKIQTDKQRQMIREWIDAEFVNNVSTNNQSTTTVKPTPTSSTYAYQQVDEEIIETTIINNAPPSSNFSPMQQSSKAQSLVNDEQSRLRASIEQLKRAVNTIITQFTNDIAKENNAELNKVLTSISAANTRFIDPLGTSASRNVVIEDSELKKVYSQFNTECNSIIQSAIGKLQDEPKWIDYLSNLLIKIANAAIFVVTFGQKSNFFAPVAPTLNQANQCCTRLSDQLSSIAP